MAGPSAGSSETIAITTPKSTADGMPTIQNVIAPILDPKLRVAHPCGRDKKFSLFMQGEKAAAYQAAMADVYLKSNSTLIAHSMVDNGGEVRGYTPRRGRF